LFTKESLTIWEFSCFLIFQYPIKQTNQSFKRIKKNNIYQHLTRKLRKKKKLKEICRFNMPY